MKVRITISYFREVKASDFITDDDYEDEDDGDEPELSDSEVLERMRAEYADGDRSPDEDSGFADASIKIEKIR